MWCFARLFHYPGAELLQAISLYCLRHWHRFKPQELANMIWSLALLRACSPHTWSVPLNSGASCTGTPHLLRLLPAHLVQPPEICMKACTGTSDLLRLLPAHLVIPP